MWISKTAQPTQLSLIEPVTQLNKWVKLFVSEAASFRKAHP